MWWNLALHAAARRALLARAKRRHAVARCADAVVVANSA
jgi:hypothetical protein